MAEESTNYRRPPRATQVLLAMFIAIGVSPICHGQGTDADVADVSPDSATISTQNGGKITLHGRIVDYNGKYLRFKLPNQRSIQIYETSAVIKVETPHTRDHIRGSELFRAGKIAEADQILAKAVENEARAWVQREINAMRIRCAVHQDDLLTAGMRFIELTRRDPNTIHFNLIPLVWSPREFRDSWQQYAKVWLSDDSDVARLIGASFMLDSQSLRPFAEAELRRLSIVPHMKISSLARAQRWRTKLTAATLSESEVKGWATQIKSMPADVRGGPYYLLGRGLIRQQHFERGAAAMLWVPLVYSEDHHLAARASVEAAQALQRVGQSAHARRLYEEATTRFSDTTFAQDARSALFEMNASK